MKTYTINRKSRYYFVLCTIVLLTIQSSKLFAQDSGHNYIKTTTYKEAITNSIEYPTPDKAVVEISYFDGLGRPKQKILYKQAANGNDMVTHIEHDGFGRQPREFLPYERTASYAFDPNGLVNTTSYYSTSAPSITNYPWMEKIYEESPLSRILEQASPGNEWALVNGQTVKYSYNTNSSNEVHHFSVNLEGVDPTLGYHQRYHEGHLYKNIVKDENWLPSYGDKGTSVEYKDKMGRVVLKRRYENPTDGLLTDPPVPLDTYYVYDDYGNLTFVLSPKLSHQIPTNGSIPQALLDELAYQYRYDYRNRLIEKKIPGKHWEYMVYDDLDRLTATGPALSPFGDQAEGWLHTKYDIHNRVAYTLWKEGPVGKTEREGLANGLPTFISEVRIPGNTVVNGVTFNYSNQVPPTSSYHVLTVNYYDDYSYTGAPSTIPAVVGDNDIFVHYNSSIKPKGLPTGSWIRQLETAGQQNGITSYSLYDKKARPVRMKSTNVTSGYTQTDTKFNFIGNPLYTKIQHKKDASGYLVTSKDVFTYTDQSLPLMHTHKINSAAEQLLSLNQYDALGRLTIKKVGGSDLSGAAALQKVDYKYNIRGWMTEINDIIALAKSGAPLDLFAFKVNYTAVEDDINGKVIPLYNGNIAETYWRSSSDNIKRKYGYSYDHQNRLMDAYYQLPGTSVPRADSYSTHYSYDRNGNLLSLSRNGEQDIASSVIQIDELVYSYDNSDNSNRLLSVRDYETPAGYFDQHLDTPSEPDFDYDTYGNLIKNRDKQITNIKYNHLNLPVEISFYNGGKIEYFYDATGSKLKKKVTDGTTITTTDYMDGFQYTASKLDFFPHNEGYVKALASSFGGPTTTYTFKYVFSYTDHLGNIRVKYAQNPANGNQIEILEEDHYYPYGLKHNGYNGNHTTWEIGPGGIISLTPVNPFLGDTYKYKFGGKEYQEEFDINIYDISARNYDPALARWMNIDPLAEMMRRYSPYNYAFDNPVFFIDPDGMIPIRHALKSGLFVSDTRYLGGLDSVNGIPGSTAHEVEPSNKIIIQKANSTENDNKINDDKSKAKDDEAEKKKDPIFDVLPPVDDFKNRQTITLKNGKSYILYDNKWIEIESEEVYDKRISNRVSSKGPPLPRGGGEINRYMIEKAMPNMMEGAITGSGGAFLGDKILNTKLSLPAAIVAGIINWTYAGYKTYYQASSTMKEHDKNVKK